MSKLGSPPFIVWANALRMTTDDGCGRVNGQCLMSQNVESTRAGKQIPPVAASETIVSIFAVCRLCQFTF